jgi:hypothetical protein
MTAPNDSARDLDHALLILQADPPVLTKNKTGQVGNQRTRYADLVAVNATVLSRLNQLGVIWKCKPLLDEGGKFVLRWCLKHVPSGTFEDGDYPLPSNATPMQNGSSITYARRYALLAVTGIAAEEEDDDGAGYGGRGSNTAARARAAAQAGPTVQRGQRDPAARPERARPESQPPLPGEAPPTEPKRGRGGLITERMTTRLVIVMNEVIGTNTGDHRQFIKDMIGREVASRKDLTFDEGRGLIDAFEKAKKTENPIAEVIDIYRRTTGEPTGGAPQTAQDKTRAAVLGRPAGPGDDAPPWETEAPPLPGDV